jgi:transposase
MARGKGLTVTFKATLQNQLALLPLDLNDMVATNHPVRIVGDILDKIDISKLIAEYKTGGASSYHPKVLLKILEYAYINNIYSSRKIEEAVCQNIYFMWLAGLNKPDHNTINRFRGKRLQRTLRPIFSQVVELLCQEGLLSLKELYTDGTKIEANANRYTFIWGNSIKTNREKIKKQLSELWDYAQQIAAEEMDDTDPSGFDKIDSEKVTETIKKINEALNDKPVDKTIRQKLNYAKKNWPSALDKYERQEAQIGEGRSSMSKIDPDATFMRLKEDHMKNGQLKPAYNVQVSTNNQYIVNYSLHKQSTDTNTLIAHLEQHIKTYKVKPANITADAGYGSEENFQWLENKRITAYVKHNQFDKSQRKGKKDDKRYPADKLVYDKQKDQYQCPKGKPMHNIGSHSRKTKTGYLQTITKYETESCKYCRLKDLCHKARGNRVIEVNHNLKRLKSRADKRLKTKRGIAKRKQRCFEVESVFGNIKQNHHFRRFMLRGIEKVEIETGLLALAHNLRKKIA